MTPAELDGRFADRLRLFRTYRGLTCEHLGGLTGVDGGIIGRTELGRTSQPRRKVSVGEAVMLARALQVPLSAFLREELDLTQLPRWVGP